jgi:hypothetical protein
MTMQSTSIISLNRPSGQPPFVLARDISQRFLALPLRDCGCTRTLHILVLRRCFRDTVSRQMVGSPNTSFVVQSIVSEVIADLHSPEIIRIFNEVSPSHSVVSIQLDPAWGNSFMYTILLHRFCELLIVYLKADSIMKAATTSEANTAASSLVRFLKTEWHVLLQIPQESLRNQISGSMLPRMLWIAGLTFTKKREPQGMFPDQPIINN